MQCTNAWRKLHNWITFTTDSIEHFHKIMLFIMLILHKCNWLLCVCLSSASGRSTEILWNHNKFSFNHNYYAFSFSHSLLSLLISIVWQRHTASPFNTQPTDQSICLNYHIIIICRVISTLATILIMFFTVEFIEIVSCNEFSKNKSVSFFFSLHFLRCIFFFAYRFSCEQIIIFNFRQRDDKTHDIL